MEFKVERVGWSEYRDQLDSVRHVVFVHGQNVPVEIERDGTDAVCTHFLATAIDGQPIGTARVDQHGHVGRVAVLEEWRRRGVGRELMEAAVAYLKTAGLPEALLNSQTSASEFYLKLGFEVRGEEFMEAGIPHIAMFKKLR